MISEHTAEFILCLTKSDVIYKIDLNICIIWYYINNKLVFIYIITFGSNFIYSVTIFLSSRTDKMYKLL